MSCRCSLRARLLVLVHIFCPCLAIYLRPLCFQIVVGSCVIVVGSCVWMGSCAIVVGSCFWMGSCVIVVGSCVCTSTLRLTCLGMSNTDADTINAMPRGKTAAPLVSVRVPLAKTEKQNRSTPWVILLVFRIRVDVGCCLGSVKLQALQVRKYSDLHARCQT